VALVQHLIVERICQPHLCGPDEQVSWRFTERLEQVASTRGRDGQLGVVVQGLSMHTMRQMSLAGDLTPQKSTFFYPKMATGLVINRLSPTLATGGSESR
jgi:uncharacterized protein (DUF1015 family)